MKKYYRSHIFQSLHDDTDITELSTLKKKN